jgi:6-phosphogluconolactonase
VSHFVYAALPSSDEIGIYREDPHSGVLTQLSDSPYGAGNAAESIVVHPSNKFMYVANADDDTVANYSLASNGVISTPGPITSAGSVPTILTMDSAGTFLYEADTGSKSITVYSIDASSGALTVVPNPPKCKPSTGNSCSFQLGFSPLNLKVNPAGNVLYVAGGTGEPSGGFILAFSISGGSLSVLV